MSENIRVLIVDDLPETRENVRKLLQFESDIEVIGQAGTGEEAVQMAAEYKPDIILMDINMPGIDGIGASQKISEMVPTAQIIIMSVQSDSDYLRRAMLAGARDFLTKPFGGDELVTAIRRVYSKRPTISTAPVYPQQRGGAGPVEAYAPVPEGNVVAVFCPKGGTGCSTVAVNVAVGLARRNYRTVLVDGSLQFGDVAVMLNLKPVASIVDLVERDTEMDAELIQTVVQQYRGSLDVLLAPPRPEMADVVTEDKIQAVLEKLRQIYDFVVVDTTSSLDDKALAILDSADRIVLLVQQNLPTLKNVSRFFDLAESLDYDAQKVWLVVNRASNKYGISVEDISKTLKRPIFASIPDDEQVVNMAIDKGVPIITGGSRRQPVGVALANLADQVAKELTSEAVPEEKTAEADKKSGGLFGRLFGGGRVRAGG